MEFVKKHQLSSFFILTYAIMIIVTFLEYQFHTAFTNALIWILAITSPTIAAVVISFMIDGSKGVKKVLGGFLKWKIGGKWYFAAFLWAFAPLVIAIIYYSLGFEAPGPVEGFDFAYAMTYVLFNIYSGPLVEEAGWRGFALPRLQEKYNALNSSLILGVIWASWHIPLYFIESRMPFYIFIILVIVITIIMTWAWNNTGGSLIVTFIFHFSFNFAGAWITGHLGLMPTMVFYITGSILATLYLVYVLIYFGPKTLSRKDISELPFDASADIYN